MLSLKIFKCTNLKYLWPKKKFGLLLPLYSCSVSSSSSSNEVCAPASKKSVISALNQETLGQPTSATHPHLINHGDLVPGIKLEEFQRRRTNLLESIQAQSRKKDISTDSKNHLVIIPSSTKKFMSDKIPYVFRQNSDFFYLSGCLEPDTILTLFINEQEKVRSTLYMRPKDKHAELWDGTRTGVDNAVDLFGVDEAYAVDKFQQEITNVMKFEKPNVWFDGDVCDLIGVINETKKAALNSSINCFHSPLSFIHAQRLFKSAAEQALMRQTCEIGSIALNEIIREARPGHSEHHLFAMMDYKCRMRNASYLAYPPVVASGNNATTIHYINNTQLIKSGDLVLMDAGCEYGGYTSDITRTWPISHVFSEPQRVLYEVILLLQKELIENYILKDGGETLDNLFDTMCIKLGKYLQEVGLVPKDVNDSRGYAQAGYKFCPHHVSHYLGMDVHDTPSMPRTLRLLPGMSFTVEPGIYIARDRKDVPVEFRGIGMRIEDDLLITADNKIEVLTSKCIKEYADLENSFKEKRYKT